MKISALGGSVLTAAVLAAACGCSASGSKPASTSAASASAPSSPAASATPGGTVVTGQSCAQMAKDAFMHLTKVQPASDGTLTITGNPSTMVCGGPDDFHFHLTTGTETGHVVKGATIDVVPISDGSKGPEQPVQASKLASYLATDQDTRTFLVGGPLSAITTLQEQYHP